MSCFTILGRAASIDDAAVKVLYSAVSREVTKTAYLAGYRFPNNAPMKPES
jgi:hypothetical protein